MSIQRHRAWGQANSLRQRFQNSWSVNSRMSRASCPARPHNMISMVVRRHEMQHLPAAGMCQYNIHAYNDETSLLAP